MSSKNCQETPRQKLIGMMYLFLTAMLALNVSKDILHAFVIVNNGLEASNKTFVLQNANMYSAMNNALLHDEIGVKPYADAADKVKILSQEMYNYVDSIKAVLIHRTEGISMEEADTINLADVDAKDNRDVGTNYLVGTGVDPSVGKARELKDRLNTFRKDLKNLLRDDEIKLFQKEKDIEDLGSMGINTSDPENYNPDHPEEKHWETGRFYNLVLAGTITMLSQIQGEIRNAEATMINKLLNSIGATDIRFDRIEARIIPKSNYVIAGDYYEADLFIAASSSTTHPKIIIGEKYDSVNHKLLGDTTIVPVIKGVGKYRVPVSGIGPRKYAAIIEVKNTSTGVVTNYPIPMVEYVVAKPSAVISPTKMNVLYVGVDNPIEVSVAGFPDEKVRSSIGGCGGSLRKVGSGKYIARVKRPGKAIIRASVTDDAGKSRSMGQQDFRVKRVPDPVAKVAGKKGGPIRKNVLLAQTGVKADLENFDFDLKFNVTEFVVSATIQGFVVNKKTKGSRFSADQKTLIRQLKSNSKVYIEDVKAIGPDGTVRKLSVIALKLQ